MTSRQHPSCPRCSSIMYRLYERLTDPETKQNRFYGCGWKCSNPACQLMLHDDNSK